VFFLWVVDSLMMRGESSVVVFDDENVVLS
jgi:hypothetical protein